MTEISTNPKHWNVGLVGYGEVGRILAEDLRKQDVKVTAYDIKLGRRSAAPLARSCRGPRRRAGGIACRSRGTIRLHHFRRDREPGRAGRAGLRAGGKNRRLFPRFQFGLAGRQAARRCSDRRQSAAAMSRAR